MAWREEPEYALGASPKDGDVWQIDRNADAVLILYVRLPDTGNGITSSDTISKGIAHIREATTDALPKLIMGNTDGRLYMTVTRPEPNLVKIVINVPYNITRDELDLLSIQDTPTRRRQEVPGDGFFDVKLITAATGHHYVFASKVKTVLRATRENAES